MRLIDADALKENTFGVYTQEYGNIEVVGCDAIDDAPTIDAVPVVRGEWVTIGMRPAGTKDTHYCSVCKGHGRNEMNHCPHCGADMRGESRG